jgi:glycosyltransferase involved in cell wall biosynthesis
VRILMISPNPLDLRLGASKVTIELAEALNALPDVRCSLVGPEQLGVSPGFGAAAWTRFNAAQREYLRSHAREFDVVDYDHEHLPFDRSEFDAGPVFVARSVLLVHYLDRIRFPVLVTPRTIASRLIHASARARFQRQRLADAARTIAQADLVNVSNDHDKTELTRHGVDAGKIVVIPFGMNRVRREKFDATPLDAPAQPVVAFVGSFDFRKGAADFPRIFARIQERVPSARLALFGTAGYFRSADQVRAFFPRRLRAHLDIYPRFEPDELPTLLSGCSVGVFPSYCEGFGFGVLEMLAAAIPVIAYDAPGPPAMLGPDWLVPPGDIQAMADKVVGWLRDPGALAAARRCARLAAAPFNWAVIARETADVYARRARTGRGVGAYAVSR